MSAQNNFFASVTSSVGVGVFLFHSMRGSEEISRLFEYTVDLLVENKNFASVVAPDIPVNKILGEAMIINVLLPTGNKKYYHGLVTDFRHCGLFSEHYFLYRAVLRPWFWFLTRSSNCQIFQEKSVPEIIKKIFQDNGFSDFKLELTNSYEPRDYCVQYRETDFDFISRLMEFEGIFYFFKHEESKHTLVIADSMNAYQKNTGYESIPYYPDGGSTRIKHEHIHDWQTSHKARSSAYVLDDYDFEVPTGNLEAKFTRLKQHSHAQAEHYDYPGNYLKSKTGETYANIRLDELQIEHELIQGRGNALGLQTGALFTLNNHYIDTENSDHVVTYTDFTINSNLYGGSTEESHYDCRFTAIRATQQFRPGRITPVPFVHGLQSATVVGKSGEEIWTDKYGRIKVQFHWDRYGKDDEKSSCWIRVAYPVAGKNWGWISLPRIGQEVVVSFLEGNPDRPLITGSVYNALQMPPYELPANQTQSGIKTRSSKDGVATNFNEIRFEDKKASEEVYIHAEKDFNCVIENNETRKIGLDKKDEGNQTVEIQNHRTVSLLAGNDTLTVKQGNRVTSVDTGNNTLQVKTGNCETNVDTGNNSLNVKTGNCNTHISTGNYVIDVDVGKVAITATTAIELTVGGNSIKIDQKGITIKGLTVTVQADVKLDAKSPLTTVNGDGTLTLKGGMTMIN